MAKEKWGTGVIIFPITLEHFEFCIKKISIFKMKNTFLHADFLLCCHFQSATREE